MRSSGTTAIPSKSSASQDAFSGPPSVASDSDFGDSEGLDDDDCPPLDPILSVPLPTSSSSVPAAHAQHLAAAFTAAPSLLAPPLPPARLTRCVEKLSSLQPADLSLHRSTALSSLVTKSAEVADRSRQLLESAHPHCRAVLTAAGSGPNLGLIEHLIDSMGWDDAELLDHLRFGFPLVGDLPVSSDAPVGVRRLATLTYDELLSAGAAACPAQLARQGRPLIPGSEAAQDSAELWSQTLAEVELGRIVSVPATSPWDGPATRRFSVRQLTSDGRSKIRCIDDFAESLVNDACTVRRRLRMGRVSDLHFTASSLHAQRPGVPLSLLKSDFKAAYRGCPVSLQHLRLSCILVQNPSSGSVVRFRQLAMPFGAVGAVYAWDRLGAFLTAVLQDVFLVAASRYVDDLFLVDYESTASEARSTMLAVVTLLGFTLEEAKTPRPASSQDILGIRVTLTDTELCIAPEPRKVALWLDCLSTAVTRGYLCLRDSSKLCGRLSFASSASWGPVSRARLRLLYRHALSGQPRLHPALAADLAWWIRRLQRLTPQRLPLLVLDPFILYTDAEGNGGLGAVLADSSGASWFSCSAPSASISAMLPRKTQIFPLEVLAVGAALRIWRARLRGRSLLVFVDNTAALSSLQKGRSRQSDVHGLVTQIWDDLCDSVIVSSIKFLWVPSKLNLADLPSRGSAPVLGTRTASRLRWEDLVASLSKRDVYKRSVALHKRAF